MNKSKARGIRNRNMKRNAGAPLGMQSGSRDHQEGKCLYMAVPAGCEGEVVASIVVSGRVCGRNGGGGIRALRAAM